MELLQPRQTYQRINSDDPNRLHGGHELRSMHGRTTSKDTPLPISQLESEPHIASLKPSARVRWFSGWRAGAYSAAALAFCSLIINTAAAIWLSRHSAAQHSSLVEVFRGSCDAVARMDVWVHLLINTISTLLLAGSNYCMQCLCAPSRPEVDEAHVNGRYLDIGIQSLRNPNTIAKRKTVMWWLLAISSIPLHLMYGYPCPYEAKVTAIRYNSAFYSSLATNDYDMVVVTPGFLSGGLISINSSYYDDGTQPTITDDDFDIPASRIQQQLASNDTVRYKRLDALSCIKAYGRVFMQDYRTLVIVSTNGSNDYGNHSSLLWRDQYSFVNAVDIPHQRYEPFDWVCEGEWSTWLEVNGIVDTGRPQSMVTTVACDSYLHRIEANASIWKPLGFDLDYCLAEVIEQQCSFNGNIPIILTVIACNVVKMALMLTVALRLRDNPLVTIGDAVESFLNVPDQCTKDLCLFTFQDAKASKHKTFMRYENRQTVWQYQDGTTLKLAGAVPTLRWSKAASAVRWTLTLALLFLALVAIAGLLVPATILARKRGASVLSLGFGTVQAATVISGWGIERIGDPALQVVAAILIANLPQLVLSLLYFSINGLLTSMWTALEWSQYAEKRNYLRVSTRKGQQRSKHFLSLPYRIAIPLMVVSGLLHWLVSQSIFLAVVAYYDDLGNLLNPLQIASCGFSPLAMIMVIVLGALVMVGTILVGRQKLDSSMPFAGSCSIVISAACHRPDWDVDASLNAVRWGALPMVQGQGGVGHCCFTSGDVEYVQVGERYAGFAETSWTIR